MKHVKGNLDGLPRSQTLNRKSYLINPRPQPPTTRRPQNLDFANTLDPERDTLHATPGPFTCTVEGVAARYAASGFVRREPAANNRVQLASRASLVWRQGQVATTTFKAQPAITDHLHEAEHDRDDILPPNSDSRRPPPGGGWTARPNAHLESLPCGGPSRTRRKKETVPGTQCEASQSLCAIQ